MFTNLTRRFVLAATTAAIGARAAAAETSNYKGGQGKMRIRGVVYDVGVRFTPGQPYSVDTFDPALVRYELNVIAKDLHATAVRIEGEEIDRLVTASRMAHAEGLTVYFNPWKMNVPFGELPAYYKQAAREAEKLRRDGVEIVFVAGCELSLFNAGIFPGAGLMDRIGYLAGQMTSTMAGEKADPFSDKWPLLNTALGSFVAAIRSEFTGQVTYAAGSWEKVDWDLFDIVGVDYYRNGESAEAYVAGLEQYRSKKPLVVMEVGCCTYEGAAARGAGGFMVLEGVNPDGSGRFLGGVPPVRSEREQADYIGEVLELLDQGGVNGAFVYCFSFPSYRTGEGARDFDLVSFALVKTFPVDDPRSKLMPPWVPKESFHRVKDFFRRYGQR